MTFLTIFTAPKPFTIPHINLIQHNAIQSWTHLGDDVEVILIGDEAGIAEAAAALNVKHLAEVPYNDWGTPLVSGIFELACQNSDSPILAYVNADILLMPDFVLAARRVVEQAKQFLLIGQRWDVDITTPVDFSPGWENRLRDQIQKEGVLHPPVGSDYFIFPRDSFSDIPDFAIGRPGWDNWMIFHARRNGWATVDATPDVMIVHQNHDYSHLPGGRPPYKLKEAHQNIALSRGPQGHYTGYIILDTNRELRNGRIRRPKPSLLRWVRQLEVTLMPREKKGRYWEFVRRIRRLRRRLTK